MSRSSATLTTSRPIPDAGSGHGADGADGVECVEEVDAGGGELLDELEDVDEPASAPGSRRSTFL